MPEQEVYYRPPSEADSFIIRVMRGCPHNKCTFCNMFKTVPCEALPLQEVLDGLDADTASLPAAHLGLLKSIYLEGGDPLALNTAHLLKIMRHAKGLFPALTRFACYATARFTIKKKAEELSALAAEGLERVFIGLESGSDRILSDTNKGCTSEDLALAGEMLAKVGIGMDVSMMLGIGGKAFSKEHALSTARLLDRISPVCVRIRTFTPKEDTELGEDFKSGRFEALSPHETLRELRLMVENIHSPMQLLSEHWTDSIHFSAQMPEAEPELLAYIDRHLSLPEGKLSMVTAVRAKS